MIHYFPETRQEIGDDSFQNLGGFIILALAMLYLWASMCIEQAKIGHQKGIVFLGANSIFHQESVVGHDADIEEL